MNLNKEKVILNKFKVNNEYSKNYYEDNFLLSIILGKIYELQF